MWNVDKVLTFAKKGKCRDGIRGTEYCAKLKMKKIGGHFCDQ